MHPAFLLVKLLLLVQRHFARLAIPSVVVWLWPALLLSQTTQTTLFSESFGGSLSQWSNVGSAQIVNGQLSVPKGLDMIYANAGTTPWTNYNLTCTVTVTAVATGVVFRSSDVSNGYMWQLSASAGALRLHRKVNGTYTQFKSVAYAFQTGTAYALRIDANGSTISTYINGSLVDTTTDTTFPQGTIGFRTGSTETGLADDVLVYTLTTTTPPDPTLPNAPTDFRASAQWVNGQPFAVLQWAGGTTGTPTGVILERRVAGTATYQRVTGLSAAITTFNDYGIQPGTSYNYRLSAYNAYGSSGYGVATFAAPGQLPLGYVDWAHSLWPAVGGSLASGSLWTDTGADGVPNAWKYAFSSNPTLDNGPGGLYLRGDATGQLQLWGRSFTLRPDLHYQLQSSADLAAWQTNLDENSAGFTALGGGPGTTVALLSANLANPASFYRWNLSPDLAANPVPMGLLLNGLAATSGMTLTQQTPAFSWQVGNDAQTAYQILVATSPSLLASGAADVWDSGQIAGSNSLNVLFAGSALQSNTTYYWTVRTWNGAGKASALAPVQTVRTGALSSSYQTDRPLVIQEAVAPVGFVRKGTGWYFVDFGRDAFGTVSLSLPTPVAGQAITVGMGEAVNGDGVTVNTNPAALGAYVRYQSQSVTQQSGVTSYKVVPTWTALYAGWIALPSYIGQVAPFRYVEIKNVPEPFVATQISQLSTHVPWDDTAGTFTSSDNLLNRVWELSKHTIKASTFTGLFVDGDRERIPYEADAYLSGLGSYCLGRDYATARYSHEYMLSHSTWPTEWLMHSILIAWNDYLYTGDARSLQANYAVLQTKLLSSRVRSDGLYTGTTISGSGSQPTDIVDWPATERDGYDMAQPVKTVTSAFRYRSLVLMQQIATVLGKASDASGYQTAAALTLSSLNSKLWDATNSRYVDGMSSAGVAGTHASLHGNMFALVFGMVPADRQASVVNYIKSRGMVCSVYGAQYYLEALYSVGEDAFALSLFDSTALRSWYNMLAAGSTMTTEAWDVSLKTNEDWNHPWGAAPANLIPRWLLGVRPLEAGFKKILIQPQPGTLAYASGVVPTIRGPVTVNVLINTAADFALRIDVPPNTTAKLGLPTLGSTSTTVMVDGAASTGSIAGKTVWLDNIPPGSHLFERQP